MDWLGNLATAVTGRFSATVLVGAIAAAVVAVTATALLVRRGSAKSRDLPVSPAEGLIAVFLRARALLARPRNDFAWSSWENAEAALAEMDGIIADLRAGRSPDPTQMQVLFAPTGPMQEVSLSSGWGDEFLTVSSQFDEAFARYLRSNEPAR
jgi:hypothetical protein